MSVLVTDAGGNHALAVVRSLGRRRITVVAADCYRLAQAALSRYCARRSVYPSPSLGIREFQEGLSRILDTRRDELVRAATQALQLLHPRFRQHGLKPFGGQRTANGLLGEDEIAHLALVHERLELAIRQVLGVRSKEHRLEYEHPDKGNHEVADRERPLFGLHLTLPFSAVRARPSAAAGARFQK